MNSTLTSAPLALAAAALAAAPASAQYGAPPPQPQQQIPVAGQNQAAEGTANISRRASQALKDLQVAVDSNDAANIPARLAAAQAAAQSADEKYFVARLQLKAATQANDQAAIAAAIEAMVASGALEQSRIAPLYLELGDIHSKNKDYSKAAAAFERVLAIDPNHADALVLLAETKNSQGQASQAASLFQRALQAKAASGQKADESWYKRAIAIAYQAQLPASIELSRQWVAAYPSPASWRDSLRIYRKIAKPDETTTLDVLRLARATGALEGDSEFHTYAFLAADNSSPGEARAVIEQAVAARQIDPNKPLFKEIIGVLQSDRSMSRDALPELAKNALAGPAARLAVRTADAYYGYGDYSKAAELYRAALARSGADASRIHLRLGMALARAGDKAGATAALNAVAGPLSELAKYWLVYVRTSA